MFFDGIPSINKITEQKKRRKEKILKLIIN